MNTNNLTPFPALAFQCVVDIRVISIILSGITTHSQKTYIKNASLEGAPVYALVVPSRCFGCDEGMMSVHSVLSGVSESNSKSMSHAARHDKCVERTRRGSGDGGRGV